MTEWGDFLIKISGIGLSGLFIILLGKYDHKKKLPLWIKFILQGFIAYLLITFGIKIEFLRNIKLLSSLSDER